MLYVEMPPPLELPAVSKQIEPIAFLLIIPELSLVDSAVCPLHPANALHFAPGELSLVSLAICKRVYSLTLHLIRHPVAFERTLPEVILPITVSLALKELSLKPRPILPLLLAFAMLSVEFPLAHVDCAFRVGEDAVAVSHGHVEVAFVNVADGVYESAPAVSIAHNPIALISGAIWPLHFAFAISEPSSPVPRVLGSIIVFVRLRPYSFSMRLVNTF